MAKTKVITISFKNNDDELELYEYLKSKSSPSIYVKELLERDRKGVVVQQQVAQPKEEVKKKINPNLGGLASLQGVGK